MDDRFRAMRSTSINRCWKHLVFGQRCHKVEEIPSALSVRSMYFSGAMYMLVGINPSEFRDIQDDKEFFTQLICEESISCLPASVSERDRSSPSFVHFSRSLVLIISFGLSYQRPWRKPKKRVRESSSSVDAMPKLIFDPRLPLYSILLPFSRI